MIERIEFPKGEMPVGESWELRVWGAEPLTVEIMCFSEKPPPPRFKSCPECGTSRVLSGVAKAIRASPSAFGEAGVGRLVIVITDADGDQERLEVRVQSNDPGIGPAATARYNSLG